MCIVGTGLLFGKRRIFFPIQRTAGNICDTGIVRTVCKIFKGTICNHPNLWPCPNQSLGFLKQTLFVKIHDPAEFGLFAVSEAKPIVPKQKNLQSSVMSAKSKQLPMLLKTHFILKPVNLVISALMAKSEQPPRLFLRLV